MALSDVIGQEHAAACLRSAARSGRVAHAYLFQGPAGVGKARMAVEFTKLLSCEAAEDEPCGRCRACRLIDSGNWPDLHILQPEESKRFINVEQVRNMIERVNLRSIEGEYKLFVIRDADHLREDAQNILLKTLEEPPAGSVLILITARPDRLAETLHSRAQRVRFRRLRREELQRVFEAQARLTEAERRFAADFACGSVGRALELVESDAAVLRDELLERLSRLRTERAFGIAEEVHEAHFSSASVPLEVTRRLVRRLVDVATLIYRDLMVLLAGSDVPLYNGDCRSRLEALAERMAPGAPERCVARLLQGRTELDQNANLRLLLQALFMDLAQLQAA